MELKTVTVSKSKIVIPRIEKEERPVKAGDIFSVPFSNIFLCAMKQSGKTTVLSNIIWKCAGKNTKIIIICSTVDRDPTYIHTVKKLREKGYDVITLTEIVDPDNKINAIQEFMDEHRKTDDDDDEDEDEDESASPTHPSSSRPSLSSFQLPVPKRMAAKQSSQPSQQIFGSGTRRPPLTAIQQPVKPPPIPPPTITTEKNEPKSPKKRKTTKIVPDYIIVLDDLGSELRDKALTQLMKTNRHYKALVLISSQHLNDLKPDALRQLGYVMLFARFSGDKLIELYQKLDVQIPFDEFERLYRDATKKKYNFLFLDRAAGADQFRKGFTEKYITNAQTNN